MHTTPAIPYMAVRRADGRGLAGMAITAPDTTARAVALPRRHVLQGTEPLERLPQLLKRHRGFLHTMRSFESLSRARVMGLHIPVPSNTHDSASLLEVRALDGA